MALGAVMIGQLLDRRYRIIKVLRSGEFGQTYLAADTHRPGYPQCLVRQLRPPSNNPRTLQIIELLFKKKAESLEKLGKHDQIPQLLAFFEENKEFYLVEEFISGPDLASEIGHGKPLNEAKTLLLLQEILAILVFVHGQGIVHRDIRPENLIRRESDGKLVLIDFGPVKEIGYQLMKAQGQPMENGGRSLLSYMPQEQFQGNPSYNSDLYAVGAIAIQALTGLSSQEVGQLLSAEHNGDLPNGDRLASRTSTRSGDSRGRFRHWQQGVYLSQGFSDILDRMVHPDLTQRYHSATEVLAELRKVKASDPVLPLPPPPALESRVESRSPVDTPQMRVARSQLPSNRLLPIAISIAAALVLLTLGFILYSSYAKQRVTALKNSGVNLANSGDPQAAIAQLSRAIELDPNNPESYYKRGNVYYNQKKYAEAIADYTTTIQLDPNKIDAYYNRGLAEYDAGNYTQAVQDFARLLQSNPNDAEAHYKRGLAYHELEDYEAAIADYTEAIRLNPAQAKSAYLNRGLSRSAAGDKTAALADFSEAIKLDPENPDAYYSRGRSRFFLADYQGAMEDYTQAIAFNPDSGAYYANRCAAYLNLFEYEEAISDCTQAIALDAKDATAYGNRCIAYKNIGDYAKAVEDCTAAIQLNPEDAKYYTNRGLARSAAGDREGAIDDYTKSIQKVPNDAVSYKNRADTYADMGNYSQAIADYAQAIRLKPDYDTAYHNRGLVRVKLGDRIGAIEDLQKAGTLCLDRGMAKCYNDAQFQIRQLRGES